MASFLAYILRWPSVENFISAHIWTWPMCETFHFIGLALLVGIVGMFDLRVLGMVKGLPLAPFQRLIPWAVFGFVLCLITGGVFVTGIAADLHGSSPYEVLMTDTFLQWKLFFMVVAGINALVFYLTDVGRAVNALGPGDDAPLQAKFIAGTSLSCWILVMWYGRAIPLDLDLQCDVASITGLIAGC